MVGKVKLEAGNPTEQRVLDYLNENASDVLAEKINTGKKTLAGALEYCKEQARDKAINGCACIDDATVFGWVMHFFEEDDIADSVVEREEKAAAQKKEAAEKKKARVPKGVKTKPKKKAPAKKAKPTAALGKCTRPTEKKKPAKPEPQGPIFLELFKAADVASTKPEAVS